MATKYGDVDVVFGHPDRPNALPLSSPQARYCGFAPGRTILSKGSVKRAGCLPLPCDIIYDKDVPVTLRDGCTIRTDIYRPIESAGKVPAIVAWSPYGKDGGAGNQILDDFPFRMGVPLSKLSEHQKWEGPDPGYWVQHGYAIVNPDARGAGKSEGNIYQFGSQEGRDGADLVDWIGEQSWCNGKVGLSGNSWLAIAQWLIAAERPRHLACIAPWEGFSDLFAHFASPGGALSQAALDFNLKVQSLNAGENSWENINATIASTGDRYTAYHNDKRARVENINVPAYVTASYTNPVHTFGTFATYARLQNKKWLRIHDSWEWTDYYDGASLADLLRFFDCYLKGVDNGWEETPAVRTKILDTANSDPLTGSSLVFNAFPPPEATPVKLYFDFDGSKLGKVRPDDSSSSYESSTGSILIRHQFDQDVTLCGPLEIGLAVSVQGNDDADVYITTEKILNNGSATYQLKVPFEKWYQRKFTQFAYWFGLAPSAIFYHGPQGGARVSQHKLDPAMSSLGFPVPDSENPSRVQGGEVVRLYPAMTPIGMHFSKGESLAIRISGKNPCAMPPLKAPVLTQAPFKRVNDQGQVFVHSGRKDGEDSYIVLPVVEGHI